MENKTVIGSRIRTIREFRGFKQEEIAKAIGMEISKYSRLENDKIGKLEDDILKKIASELGVTVADLKSQTPALINFASNNGTQISYNENYYADQKDLYEKHIISLKEQIESQKEQIQLLNKQNEQLLKMFDKLDKPKK